MKLTTVHMDYSKVMLMTLKRLANQTLLLAKMTELSRLSATLFLILHACVDWISLVQCTQSPKDENVGVVVQCKVRMKLDFFTLGNALVEEED